MNIDPSILNTFITLVVSVGLIWVILFFVKKYSLKFKKATNAYNLSIAGKISLQPKTHLFVVEAGDKKLLVGVAEKNINLIADLTDGVKSGSSSSSSSKKIEGNDYSKQIDLNQAALKQYISETRKAAGQNSDRQPSQDPAKDDLSFRSFIKSALKKNSN